MQIDGLITERHVGLNGEEIFCFYKLNRSRSQHIQLIHFPDGSASVTFLEGKSSPGISPAERITLFQDSKVFSERLVRAMAKLHLNVDDACNAVASIDMELVRRGFEIRFALDGVPAWVRIDGAGTVVVSKLNEMGLPMPEDDCAQALVTGRLGGNMKISSHSLANLLQYLDAGKYAGYLLPGHISEMWLSEGDPKKLH